MFTLLIAEKGVFESIDKYKLFLKPLLDRDNIALCEWNRGGETIGAMIPEARGLISKQKEWRAVIINPDGRYQKNPFDHTGYLEHKSDAQQTDWDELARRKTARFECYERAINNPLVRLAAALCGAPAFEPRADRERLLSDTVRISDLMLETQLGRVSVAGFDRHIDNLGKDSLKQFTDEKNLDKLIAAVRKKNAAEVMKIVGLDNLIHFITFLGGDDPGLSDPEYTAHIIENAKKAALFDAISPAFDFKTELPSEVVCLAARTCNSEMLDAQIVWEMVDETKYSRFPEFNLYPDKLKYIVFDMVENDHAQHDYDMIRFLSFALVLSGGEIPPGALSKARVYRADCVNDRDNLSLLLTAYHEKLKKTAAMLKEKQEEVLLDDKLRKGSPEFAGMINAPVPVYLSEESGFEKSSLMAGYKDISFAKDCPVDEQAFWGGEYIRVYKGFQQYIKQPRRALIRAAEDMKTVNFIDDEEAMYLDRFQIEDVYDGVNDAELRMLSIETADLYDTDAFFKRIEADRKSVRQFIDTRMTKKITVISGIVGLAALFLGFIPLFITSGNTFGSFIFSLIVTLAACGLVGAAGFCCLIWLRYSLRKRIRKFNDGMDGILKLIKQAMLRFSEYLTCACKFMRGYSAINMINEKDKKTAAEIKIYRKHILDIQRTGDEYQELFRDIGLSPDVDFSDIDAYDFDFTQPADYEYELPFGEWRSGTIEFLQDGNVIDAPVSYIERLTLRREELYDV